VLGIPNCIGKVNGVSVTGAAYKTRAPRAEARGAHE
jgi:hypothetical protein